MEKIGYVRTSLKEEHIENQIKAIKDVSGEDIKLFEDSGVSGIAQPGKRPGFKALIGYITTNADVKKLYVYEISRIGRTFMDTLDIVGMIEKRGVKVISVSPKESWMAVEDKSIRQLIMAIFAWVAERERGNMIERTKAGIERARAEGKQIGRPLKDIDWKVYRKWRKKGVSKYATSIVMQIPYQTLINRIKKEGIVE